MKMLKRIGVTMVAMVAAVASASAQGTLRIGMTSSDIPLTTGQADNGGEGMRFMGYTVNDGLINWDLSSADKASDLAPGLATSWSVDEADKTKWTFRLREGVKFHDGSGFMVTHDINSRAMSAKVKGFVQAQNWFQDFSPVTMTK